MENRKAFVRGIQANSKGISCFLLEKVMKNMYKKYTMVVIKLYIGAFFFVIETTI